MPRYETTIPTDLLPPLEPFEIPPPSERESTFDEALWADAGELASASLSGEVVIDPADDWTAPGVFDASGVSGTTDAIGATAAAEVPSSDAVLAPETGETGEPADALDARWVAIRDANIRPYLDWRPPVSVPLPPLVVRPGQHPPRGPQPQQHHAGPPRHGGRPGYNGPGPRPNGGGGGGGNNGRRRRGRDRDRDRPRNDHSRHRDRGPRLPGFYNPGGD